MRAPFSGRPCDLGTALPGRSVTAIVAASLCDSALSTLAHIGPVQVIKARRHGWRAA